MLKQIARLKVGLVLLGMLVFCSSAFASGVVYRQDNGRDNRGDTHYYRNGRWYKHDARGREIVVTTLPMGARVVSLPPQRTTIVVQGASYYHDDHYYYRPETNGGYVVVSRPTEDRSRPQQNNNDNRNNNNQGDRGGNGQYDQNRDGRH